VVDDDELKSVMNEISDRYGPLPGDVILLGELMGIKAIARRLGVLALEVSSTRVAIAVPDDSPLHKAMPRNWRRLPDGRYAANPPARAALVALSARAGG
jgi:transcription-repair coupling factor (superfamily II helicase)